MANQLSVRCHWVGCSESVELPDDGHGQIPLEPLRGWFYDVDNDWLCPIHEPAYLIEREVWEDGYTTGFADKSKPLQAPHHLPPEGNDGA